MHKRILIEVPSVAYPQTCRRQNLFAGYGMDNGKVALHADDHQDEYRSRVAQRVHKLIHPAEELSKHPAKKKDIPKNMVK